MSYKASFAATAGLLGALFTGAALADGAAGDSSAKIQLHPSNPAYNLFVEQGLTDPVDYTQAPQDSAVMYADISNLIKYMSREMPVVNALGSDVQAQMDEIKRTIQPLDALINACPNPNIADYAIAAHWGMASAINMFQNELALLAEDPRFGDGHYNILAGHIENVAGHLGSLEAQFDHEQPQAQGFVDDLLRDGVIEESATATFKAMPQGLGVGIFPYEVEVNLFPLQKYGPYSSFMEDEQFNDAAQAMLAREHQGPDAFWSEAPRFPEHPSGLSCLPPTPTR
jgi:hypothetical protein